MDYGMISKIQKAKRYAQERERFEFTSFTVTFKGENSVHEVRFENGNWHCTCEFFLVRGICSHTMALERLMDGMMPEPAVNGVAAD